MNNGTVSTYPIAPTTSGRHKVQSYAKIGASSEKTPLWTGLGSAAPIGKCVLRVFLPLVGQLSHFHLEGVDGAADAATDNGMRLDGYYTPSYVDFVVDPRTQTHIDLFGGAGTRVSWYIISSENQSHPGG